LPHLGAITLPTENTFTFCVQSDAIGHLLVSERRNLCSLSRVSKKPLSGFPRHAPNLRLTPSVRISEF
jgi:hypothetical protein